MSRRFLLVGLTGGIATGKSTVSDTLRGLGGVIIDADLLAREVVAPGQPALAAIVREFVPSTRHAQTGSGRPLASIGPSSSTSKQPRVSR